MNRKQTTEQKRLREYYLTHKEQFRRYSREFHARLRERAKDNPELQAHIRERNRRNFKAWLERGNNRQIHNERNRKAMENKRNAKLQK